MRWILDNLNLIIVIAGAIAWWLNQRMREKAGQEADYDSDGVPEARPTTETFEDPQLAERTRRIREEIQRKIAERRSSGEGYTEPARPGAAPLSEAPPVLPVPRSERPAPRTSAEPPPLVREVVVSIPQTVSLGDSRRMAELLEQQAALAEQLKQAEQMKAAALRRTAFEEATSDRRVAARQETRRTVIEELRDPAALRRAFIEREILGPPVALR